MPGLQEKLLAYIAAGFGAEGTIFLEKKEAYEHWVQSGGQLLQFEDGYETIYFVTDYEFVDYGDPREFDIDGVKVIEVIPDDYENDPYELLGETSVKVNEWLKK